MRKKIFAGILALSMFLIPTARAEEIDPLIKDYIPRIESGEIKPPQYSNNRISGENPTKEEWIKSVESQAVGGGDAQTTIYVSKNQKEIKVKKVDKNGNPLKGVEFKLYLDSTINSYEYLYSTSLTDENGIATFKVEDFYYGGYIKETKTLDKYILRNKEKDIVRFYKDNGVRFIGEKKSSDFKVNEAKNEQNLNQYLQSLIENDTNRNEYGYYVGPKDSDSQIDRLVFNDNGIEKLIPKKSLKHTISWDNIKAAGLVDGKKTVTIDEKTYKIRLMDESNTQKDSEWDRMMLPLVGIDGKERNRSSAFGRFNIDSFEKYMKNMPILANYTWFNDLGGYSIGSSCWTQKTSSYTGRLEATFRGNRNSMAYSYHYISDAFEFYYNSDTFGWLPVLEEVK